MTIKNSFKNLPNEKGYFGSFGGRYVSETLMPLILEVEKEYEKIKNESEFKEKLNHYMETYIGRPSPRFFSERNALGSAVPQWSMTKRVFEQRFTKESASLSCVG